MAMDLQKQLDELRHPGHVEWGDWIIKHNGDGIVAHKKGESGNPMPGACTFTTVKDAQKGIAALEIARRIAKDEADIGATFWFLIELTR